MNIGISPQSTSSCNSRAPIEAAHSTPFDAEASALFERLLSLRNDVGLLAEEYDPHAQRQVGNFPQAFSHLALIGTALNLHDIGPAQQRGRGAKPNVEG